VAAPGHNRGVGDVVASSRVGCTPATVPGPRLAAGGNIWRRMSPIPILATEVRIQLADLAIVPCPVPVPPRAPPHARFFPELSHPVAMFARATMRRRASVAASVSRVL
jgi:hypothetical protein